MIPAGANSSVPYRHFIKKGQTEGTAGYLVEVFATDTGSAATYTAGSDGQFTADNATAATAIDATDLLKMTFNGHAIDVTLATVGAATYNAEDDIQDLADDLKTINSIDRL